jgi:Xaa-Pro aminopeptidase
VQISPIDAGIRSDLDAALELVRPLPDGHRDVPGIAEAEYRDRVARIQAAMTDQGYDALVLFSDSIRSSSVRYVCDFWPIDGFSDIAFAVVTLPREGAPTLFASEMNLLWAEEVAWFGAQPFSELPRSLIALRDGIGKGTVGLTGLSFMPVPLHETIRGALGLGSISVRPAEELLAPVKARKSEAEIALLQRAGELTIVGLDAVHEAMQMPGDKTERDVAAHAAQRIIAAGGDRPAFDIQIQSGPHSAYNNIRSTDRVIREGDSILIEMGARYGSYVTDIARGATVGAVDPRQVEIIEVAAEALGKGCDAARPGISAGALNDVVEQSLVEAGYLEYSAEARGYGTGHGIGTDIEEEEPWIRPGSTFVLEENMAMALKASVFVPGLAGVRVEDNVLVTSDGAKVYTPYPRVITW